MQEQLPREASRRTYMYTSYFATLFECLFHVAIPFSQAPCFDNCFSNQGKTAYVYPACELSRASGLWPK